MAKTTSPEAVIEPGNAAPGFALKDQHERTHRLDDYRGRWVALYFYPRDHTPGCTKQACQFRDTHEAFEHRGVVALGVSADDEASHAKFAGKHDLPFPLLADHEAKVASAYGVWREKNMYGKKFFGIVRTTYLIDPRGNVAERWDEVKVADHAQAILTRLDELGG